MIWPPYGGFFKVTCWPELKLRHAMLICPALDCVPLNVSRCHESNRCILLYWSARSPVPNNYCMGHGAAMEKSSSTFWLAALHLAGPLLRHIRDRPKLVCSPVCTHIYFMSSHQYNKVLSVEAYFQSKSPTTYGLSLACRRPLTVRYTKKVRTYYKCHYNKPILI